MRRTAGLLLGFASALIILAPWSGAQERFCGALACLIAAACYGLSYVYMGRCLTGRGLSPLVLSSAQLLAATALLVLATAVAGRQQIHLTLELAGAVVVLGTFGTGVAHVLNYRLIRDDGATTASAVTYLLPVVAVLLGVALLGEPSAWHMGVGTLVVLVGVALVRHHRSGDTQAAE